MVFAFIVGNLVGLVGALNNIDSSELLSCDIPNLQCPASRSATKIKIQNDAIKSTFRSSAAEENFQFTGALADLGGMPCAHLLRDPILSI